jgi:hypothetical protein
VGKRDGIIDRTVSFSAGIVLMSNRNGMIIMPR